MHFNTFYLILIYSKYCHFSVLAILKKNKLLSLGILHSCFHAKSLKSHIHFIRVARSTQTSHIFSLEAFMC